MQGVAETVSGGRHVFVISAAGKPELQSRLVQMRKKGISVTWVATVFGGEDDTRNVMSGLETILFRWKG